jgi:flagella synthesis protein FlgN
MVVQMLKTNQRPSHLLRAELETLQFLLELLKTEQLKLVSAEVDSLPAITREKSGLVSHLNQLAKERQQVMQDAGFTLDENGMRAWLISDESQDYAGIWNELLNLTKAAKELNRVNGLLINKHLAVGNQKLNVLSSAARGGNLYGPDGQSRMKAGLRSLVVG